MNALDLIKKELERKAEKHGFDDDFIRDNPQYYGKEQLINAAIFCLTLDESFWPSNWDSSFAISIKSKTNQERVIVASAFLVNEVDKAFNPPKMKDSDQPGFNQYFH